MSCAVPIEIWHMIRFLMDRFDFGFWILNFEAIDCIHSWQQKWPPHTKNGQKNEEASHISNTQGCGGKVSRPLSSKLDHASSSSHDNNRVMI